MRKELWFDRLLKFLGIKKTVKVSKKEMCEKAQSICRHNCEMCTWNEVEDE